MDVAVSIMHAPLNEEAMTVVHPLISNVILACIAVLPASIKCTTVFCYEKDQDRTDRETADDKIS